jgi:hypothetical protein
VDGGRPPCGLASDQRIERAALGHPTLTASVPSSPIGSRASLALRRGSSYVGEARAEPRKLQRCTLGRRTGSGQRGAWPFLVLCSPSTFGDLPSAGRSGSGQGLVVVQ